MPRFRRKARVLVGDLALCSLLVAGVSLAVRESNPWAPAVVLATLPVAFYLAGLYELEAGEPGEHRERPVVQTLVACALAGMCVATLQFLIGPLDISRKFVVGSLAPLAFLLPLARRSIERLARQTGEHRVPVLVLGGNGRDKRLLELLRGHGLFELRSVVTNRLGSGGADHALAGLVNGGENGAGGGNRGANGAAVGGRSGAAAYAGTPQALALAGAPTVVVADPRRLPESDFGELLELRRRGVQVKGLPEFWEEATGRLPVFDLTDEWLAIHSGILRDDHTLTARLKRVMDVVGGMLLLVLLSVPTALAALAIWLNDPGPVLYRQRRVGKDGKPFQVLKLRTMLRDADRVGPAWTEERDARITPVGRFARNTRLDEVPQLLNVIRGEMSLVGPRPEAEVLSQRYAQEIPRYELRYLVKPGVTGWAQVRFRNTSSVEDAATKLEYDLYYVRKRSLPLDLRVLMKTVYVVLFGRGR